MSFYDGYEYVTNLNHVYIVENIPTNNTEEMFDEHFTEGCDCIDLCIPASCKCVQKFGASYSYKDNISEETIDRFTLNENKINTGIYECNISCKCTDKLCGNRLVQFGPNKYLEIRETTTGKGKGLFSTHKIHKGQFICEYAGEIILKEEALKRFAYNEKHNLMNYILCVNEHFGANKIVTFVDPSNFGNIGRYANHSCNPNCEIIPVRIDNMVPKISLFAKTAIENNVEITFDYGESSYRKNEYLKPCLCNEANCKKWMPYYSLV